MARQVAPAAAPRARAEVERSGAVAVRCHAGPPAIAAGVFCQSLSPDPAAGRGIAVKHRSVLVGPERQPSAPDLAGFRPDPEAPLLDPGLGPTDCGWLPAVAPVQSCSWRSRAPAAPVRGRLPADPRRPKLRWVVAADSADPADFRHPGVRPGSAGPPHARHPSGFQWIPVRRSSGDGSPGRPGESGENRSAGIG